MVNGWVRVVVVAVAAVRAGFGVAWCGSAGAGWAGEAELGQVGGIGWASPGWFRLGWCGGYGGPAWWPTSRGWPGGGTEVAGGAERGDGLGGALLGLAQPRDGLGEPGEAD